MTWTFSLIKKPLCWSSCAELGASLTSFNSWGREGLISFLLKVTSGGRATTGTWTSASGHWLAFLSMRVGPFTPSLLPVGKSQLHTEHTTPWWFVTCQHVQGYSLLCTFCIFCPNAPRCDPLPLPKPTTSTLWAFIQFSTPDCPLHQEALSVLSPSHTQFSLSHGTFIHLLIYSTNISKHSLSARHRAEHKPHATEHNWAAPVLMELRVWGRH